MSKQQQKSVPKLRFPEFDGEWDILRLEDVAKIASGGTPSRSNLSYWEGGKIPWVTTSLINFNKLSSAEEHITQKGLENSSAKLFKAGTVLIAMYGQGKTRGKTALLNVEAATNQACVALSPNPDLSGIYLFQFLSGSYDSLRKLSNDGGQKNLSAGLIKRVKIPQPSFFEQQKIASFLSVVDTKIEQLGKKKALLEQYKKGMIQKLFSQTLRFTAQGSANVAGAGRAGATKDEVNGEAREDALGYEQGNDYPDWEKKRLRDVAERPAYGMNAAAIPFDGLHKYIRITDIDESSRKFTPSPLTSPDGIISNGYKLTEGDILFARTGASTGRSYIYQSKDGEVYFAGFLIRFHVSKAYPRFIFFNTLTRNYEKWVVKMSMRSGQPGINAKEFSKYPINIPCFEEQQKIANFLSAIDKKINLIATELEKAQTFKKGLLQQMFV